MINTKLVLAVEETDIHRWRDTTLRQRFIDNTCPEPNTGCILWLGSTDKYGYGVVRLLRKAIGAHRIAWALAARDYPDGLWVLHACDNPPCVNVRHLFLGNSTDNARDMALKNRGVKSGRGLPYGVRRHHRGRLFEANVCLGGVVRYAGLYATAEEATRVAEALKRLGPDGVERTQR